MFDKKAYQREYMRRRRAGAAAKIVALHQQHAAHVEAWLAALPAMARLEHLSFARRCRIAAARA